MTKRAKSFDNRYITKRTWVYRNEKTESGEIYQRGITLEPNGVVFWCIDPDEEMFGGGGYCASFEEFLRNVKRGEARLRSIPVEVLDEVRALIEAARR